MWWQFDDIFRKAYTSSISGLHLPNHGITMAWEETMTHGCYGYVSLCLPAWSTFRFLTGHVPLIFYHVWFSFIYVMSTWWLLPHPPWIVGVLSMFNWKACFPSEREGHFGSVFPPEGRAYLPFDTPHLLHLSRPACIFSILLFSLFSNSIDLNLQKKNSKYYLWLSCLMFF